MSGVGVSPYKYSDAAVFGSEAIAMCFTIYIGEAIIANELLAKTKGQAMGWGFVALGFGLSFGVSIVMLGYISAHLNPATCLALWILGKIDFVEFIAAVAGEFVGAFFGAVLVWLHYLPHFKTVPEPPATSDEDLLLRSRDYLNPTALNIASYNTTDRAKKLEPGGLSRAIADVKFYLLSKDYQRQSTSHVDLVKLARGDSELKEGPQQLDGREQAFNHLRRHTVQVCDVHRRLKDVDLQTFQDLAVPTSVLQARQTFADFGDVTQRQNWAPQNGRGVGGTSGISARHIDVERMQPHVDARSEKVDKLYTAAVIADQNAKLSIFATRPAIYAPLFNFLTEFMCTTALIFAALMMYARREQLLPEERALFRSFEGMWIGFMVFVLILGLGGPTGIAANPARDFSPRLAHFILPIPGKGPSEWYYGLWVPTIAPLLGGCAAAGLYYVVQLMNHSNVA